MSKSFYTGKRPVRCKDDFYSPTPSNKSENESRPCRMYSRYSLIASSLILTTLVTKANETSKMNQDVVSIKNGSEPPDENQTEKSVLMSSKITNRSVTEDSDVEVCLASSDNIESEIEIMSKIEDEPFADISKQPEAVEKSSNDKLDSADLNVKPNNFEVSSVANNVDRSEILVCKDGLAVSEDRTESETKSSNDSVSEAEENERTEENDCVEMSMSETTDRSDKMLQNGSEENAMEAEEEENAMETEEEKNLLPSETDFNVDDDTTEAIELSTDKENKESPEINIEKHDNWPVKDNTKKQKEYPEYDFPKTLEGFEYAFNSARFYGIKLMKQEITSYQILNMCNQLRIEKNLHICGELRHTKTGEPFEFVVREKDSCYNQKRYEALGEVITEHVYKLLETEAKLKRVNIPLDVKDDEPQSLIFHSEDALDNPDKLLILIHGSGVVRAGQWARRLIINDNLNSGTQLPFIKKGQEEGYGILVLDTNNNSLKRNGVVVSIRNSSSAIQHALYVWDEFVSKAKAQHIAIVAHSYGGVVTFKLAVEKEEFLKRVFALALTDSVHSLCWYDAPKNSSSIIQFYKQKAKNWVSSKEKVDTPIPAHFHNDCPKVSAGHPKHEMTSWSSFKSIFEFLDKKYKDAQKNE